MSYEKEFLKEFESWVNTQVMINEIAMNESEKTWQEERDQRAKDAFIRYESRLDAYKFLQGKFYNYRNQKSFNDMPDENLGTRHY
ncbi:MAG: DUF1912 family protein [Streptococcus sp.]|nr:DUF1912 family protein [Streptococcus sp.]